jgi:hypothetical protein
MAHLTHRRRHKKLARLRDIERKRFPMRYVWGPPVYRDDDWRRIVEELTSNMGVILLPSDVTVKIITPKRNVAP